MNSIIKRKVFCIQIKLMSPLSVSSGEDEWTDADVLRDYNGTPFVAGSSIAGAMRAYLEKEKDCPCLLGYSYNSSGETKGKMSSLYISDITFEENVTYGVRDGVELDENKQAKDKNKFDMEIIEAGVEGIFYMEIVIRAQDDEENMSWEMSRVFQGINTGEIRLGSKKTRGFGKFKLISLAVKDYTQDNYLEYADAYKVLTWEKQSDELQKWLQIAKEERKMIHLEIPLRLEGGISIRQYAAKKNEPDFVQLMDHGVPVIPGSSFAGALRHRIESILRALEEDGNKLPNSVGTIIDRAFGYVEGKKSCASNIIISEVEIRGAKPLTIVRTGISRFEAAVRDGALYKERTYVDGEVDLEILVRKAKVPADTLWIVGILLLAIKDLQNGFLAVGGQTAIGRGIFSANGDIKIDEEEGREDEFIADAFKYMLEMKEK